MREPLFILSPPRSFSSLISSIIGQHPEMHAFPELQIFGRDSVLDMMLRNQESLNRLASPGAIRSVAEVHEHSQTNESCTRAWLWLQKHSHMTPVEFFNYLRKQIDPLIAIEKTPINTLKISRLSKIISTYPNAKFLHLTRSVVANHKSLKEYLAEKEKFFVSEDAEQLNAKAPSRDYTASIWLVSHRNILTLRPTINPSNYLRIKGEDILKSPFKILQHFCQWMGIDSSSSCINAMLRPHESPYACIGPRIAHGGNDSKFMRQPVLRLRPSQPGHEHSFRETINPHKVDLDNTRPFQKNKQFSDEDLRRIRQWVDHLYHEVQAMQLRLGY